MIHLSFQTCEQAVRLLWFAATGCPFPPLLPWKHMLDEAEPDTDLKYMNSKLFAFPCKESFTSCFYRILCEKEIPLGRGSFLRCLTGADADVWQCHPWACEHAAQRWNAWERAGTVLFGAGVTLAAAFGIRRVLLLCKPFALLSSPPWRGEDSTFLCTSGPQRYQICTHKAPCVLCAAPLLPSKNLSPSW